MSLNNEPLVVRIKQCEPNEEKEFSFSMESMVDYDSNSSVSYTPAPVEEHIKKRGRPPKRTEDGSIIKAKKEETPLNSNMQYATTYNITNMLLGGSIQQIDELASKIKEDLDYIRAKNYKQKYDHICQLSGNMTGLMGDKIMAIREMNNVITTCHKLEMSKMKELKLNETVDDDKRLMELYNAYINAPMGTLAQPGNNIPLSSLNMPTGNGIQIGSNNITSDSGYDKYISELSPEQHAMMFESDPNVETVLVYDQTSHQKYFEVLNIATGEVIPNMPVPSQFVLEDCNVDIRNGIAKNIKLNKTWKLKLIGSPIMNEY